MTGSTRMVLPLLVFVGLLLQPSYAQGMCLHLFVLFIFNKICLNIEDEFTPLFGYSD